MEKYVDLEINLNSEKLFRVHKFLLISRSKKFEMLIKANNLQHSIDKDEQNFEKISKLKSTKFFKLLKLHFI
jgi:hypothetical protein